MSPAGKKSVLAVMALAGMLGMCFVAPIPQDVCYHCFADSGTLMGIPNFWNVVSNLPFVLVGAWGFWRCGSMAHQELRTEYLVLCGSVVLIGLGSGYYHWDPTNKTLLWDRLPMTVAFMALFAMLLRERVLDVYRISYLWGLLTLGVATALYWAWTESLGQGDLRLYVLVQFLPILLMPLILLMFKERFLSGRHLLWAFVLYVVAKLLENFDHQVLSWVSLIGGHPLKHLAAAWAVYCILLAIPVRGSKAVAAPAA